MENLPSEQRTIVEKRSVELMAEEMTLPDLRKARKLTQIPMAKLLNMRQENVSRLERRADLLVSTLQSYIAAMGGELSFVVEFKDRPPVKISGLRSMLEETSYTNGEEEF
ncbi:XRE family transcriptional regulator [Tychonema sp. LEGE 07203]|uniref:helix-turn-helix domain-containing protein n=1 Tax=Tychonema sp. LEGE 07203 TaxID=1828671 RepID=UPI001D14D97E|nr:XRE family transcriptional regulator [Tychonema sp. LEGE 07203]